MRRSRMLRTSLRFELDLHHAQALLLGCIDADARYRSSAAADPHRSAHRLREFPLPWRRAHQGRSAWGYSAVASVWATIAPWRLVTMALTKAGVPLCAPRPTSAVARFCASGPLAHGPHQRGRLGPRAGLPQRVLLLQVCVEVRQASKAEVRVEQPFLGRLGFGSRRGTRRPGPRARRAISSDNASARSAV